MKNDSNDIVFITEWPIENKSIDLEGSPSKKRRKSTEITIDKPDIALARWWRRNKASLRFDNVQETVLSPNTRLRRIAKSREGRQFLLDQLELLENSSSPWDHLLKAFYLDKLGFYEEAFREIKISIENGCDDGEALWLHEKLWRQTQADSKREEIRKKNLEIRPSLPAQVKKRSACNFSYEDFFKNYASTRTPVIISGGAWEMTESKWNLAYIKKIAGDKTVTLKRPVGDSAEWARLENGRRTTIKDFIDSIESGKDKEYLFDWSLPIHCPKLAEELTVPKFFSGDLLGRTAPGSLYRDSWPSLFVAPAGIHSELHIDAFGSNFWMAIFEGKKKWSFFLPDDVPLLYPTYDHSLDPIFGVQVCNPNDAMYPLFALATVQECVLEPGDVLFVPAGCPHHVENLTDTVAISANFVDESNFELVKRELGAQGYIDSKAKELLRQFESFDDVSRDFK